MQMFYTAQRSIRMLCDTPDQQSYCKSSSVGRVDTALPQCCIDCRHFSENHSSNHQHCIVQYGHNKTVQCAELGTCSRHRVEQRCAHLQARLTRRALYNCMPRYTPAGCSCPLCDSVLEANMLMLARQALPECFNAGVATQLSRPVGSKSLGARNWPRTTLICTAERQRWQRSKPTGIQEASRQLPPHKGLCTKQHELAQRRDA